MDQETGSITIGEALYEYRWNEIPEFVWNPMIGENIQMSAFFLFKLFFLK
jgi:hypothetical protein